MKKPKIIIVGADKGGVGKTTVTRILRDYMKAKNVPCKYFDTEFPKGELKRYIQEADVVDITQIEDLMKVFDRLDDSAVLILDLRANLLSLLLQKLLDSQVLDDARSGKLEVVLLHVLSSSVASLMEVITISKQFGGGSKHLFVKNHVNKSTFFEWDNDTEAVSLREMMKSSTINIPLLNERANEEIQQRKESFTTFESDSNQSRMLRGEVRNWIKEVFSEFDRVEIANREDA